MATPQAALFVEGTPFHWFLHFDVAPDADLDAVRRAVGEVRARAADPVSLHRLELLVAFGDRLLSRLAGAESPAGARSFTGVVGPHGRSAVATQHDLLVWVHGDRHDLNFDAALATRRVLSDVACLVEETAGFVYRDCRDLTGFVDGTENPPAEEARELVILPEGAPGAGGSYVLVQRWVHDLDAFHALPTAEQERVIGRTKPDSVELDDLPPDSHVGRVVVEDEAGEEIEIYRRSVPYGTAAEAGLLFLAFTDDLDKFELILSRMFGTSGDGFHDRLTELSAAVSGGYYFAPAQEALDGWLS